MTTLLSLITSALGGVWGYVAAAVFAAVMSGAGVGYVVHGLDESKLTKLELADSVSASKAQAQLASLDKAEAATALSIAIADQKAQDALNVKTVTLTKEIPQYVPQIVDHPCIPVGFIRVLDAAVDQADPSALQLATGQSDATCADIDLDSLAGSVAAWVHTDQANAQELTDLQAWVTKDHQDQVSAAAEDK